MLILVRATNKFTDDLFVHIIPYKTDKKDHILQLECSFFLQQVN